MGIVVGKFILALIIQILMMYSTIKLECIMSDIEFNLKIIDKLFGLGFKSVYKQRAWVAEITGLSQKYNFERKFLDARLDYRKANSKGTRGIYANYLLEYGKIYEISDPRSWSTTERYFLLAGPHGGERMSKSDVISWLKKNTSE